MHEIVSIGPGEPGVNRLEGRDAAPNPQATGRARAEFTSASARGVQGGATQRPTRRQRAEREPNSLRRARGGFRGARRSAQPAGNGQSASRIHFGEREGGSGGRDAAPNPQATGRARAEFTSASARGVQG